MNLFSCKCKNKYPHWTDEKSLFSFMCSKCREANRSHEFQQRIQENGYATPKQDSGSVIVKSYWVSVVLIILAVIILIVEACK